MLKRNLYPKLTNLETVDNGLKAVLEHLSRVHYELRLDVGRLNMEDWRTLALELDAIKRAVETLSTTLVQGARKTSHKREFK